MSGLAEPPLEVRNLRPQLCRLGPCIKQSLAEVEGHAGQDGNQHGQHGSVTRMALQQRRWPPRCSRARPVSPSVAGEGRISTNSLVNSVCSWKWTKAAARVPAGSAGLRSWLDPAGMHAGMARRKRRGRKEDRQATTLYSIAAGAACHCAGSRAPHSPAPPTAHQHRRSFLADEQGDAAGVAQRWSRRHAGTVACAAYGVNSAICRPHRTCLKSVSGRGCSSMVEL